jgi:predicted GNAT family acetyltransferase
VNGAADALHDALIEALATLVRSLPGGDFEDRGGYFFVSYPAAPLRIFNGVWSGNDDAAAATALAADLERVRTTGVEPGVSVLDTRAPRLLAEAQRLGLTETAAIPGMVAHRSDFRATTVRGAEIRLAADDAALAHACELMAEGFELPAEWFRGIYRREVIERHSAVYVLYAAGRAVATALAVRQGDAVGIFNVATPQPDRGNGYGTAVTSRAVADGFAAGASFAYLQSSAIGESVYRRLGFEQVSTYTIAFGVSP